VLSGLYYLAILPVPGEPDRKPPVISELLNGSTEAIVAAARSPGSATGPWRSPVLAASRG